MRQVHGIGLVFKYYRDSQDGRKSFESKISLRKEEFSLNPDYKEGLKAVFLSPKSILMDAGKGLEGLLVQKKMDPAIAMLKRIEPGLADIRMGTEGRIFVDVGSDQMFPLQVMGDGFRRVLGIVAAFGHLRNGILLVDEIENGLHYSSLLRNSVGAPS